MCIVIGWCGAGEVSFWRGGGPMPHPKEDRNPRNGSIYGERWGKTHAKTPYVSGLCIQATFFKNFKSMPSMWGHFEGNSLRLIGGFGWVGVS